MELIFPPNFQFGTSTAASQIETAFDHDWAGFRTKDGYTFQRTTDHEVRLKTDAEIIASLAPAYRMSLQWSKLQRAPFAPFDINTVKEYSFFLSHLKELRVEIMMVLHHFTNPGWFTKLGGWEKEANVEIWLDYVNKVVKHFGPFVTTWNTFNEPNVYASYGWITGFFPPFKMNPLLAFRSVKNMALAHERAYRAIKNSHPGAAVGISHNTVIFAAENILGELPARISDWWFMEWIPKHFEQVDFFGMSYYARVSHDPFPITYIDRPYRMKKLGRPHDDMWEYYPQGMRLCMDRYWNRYRKPIIITESGVCDSGDEIRQRAMNDYVKILHRAIADGIDIRGYYWWSAWDNFEWHLGPTKRFGLYECDWITKERRKRPSADLYSKLAFTNCWNPPSADNVEVCL